MRRKSWWRGWAIVWAVLQLALPTAAAWAEVRAERESRTQLAHVESTSSTTCRPMHPAECAFCQALSNDGGTVEHEAPPVIVAVVRCPAADDVLASAAHAAGRRPPARAPPLR